MEPLLRSVPQLPRRWGPTAVLLRQAFRTVVRAALVALILLAPLVAQAGPIIDSYRFDGVITFTFVGSTTSTASTIDISGTGRQAGDFGVLLDYAYGASTPSDVTPSGHTQAAMVTDGSASRATISYKILAGSEGSLTGLNGATAEDKIYLVFRPSRTITTPTYNAAGAAIPDTNPSLQTIDPTAEVAALLVGQMAANAAVSPRSTSPAMDEVVGGATSHYGHYKIYNSAPASHTYDMDDEGVNNALMSGYFTFN